MRIGYARVSTDEQSLDLQLDALKGVSGPQAADDAGEGGVGPQAPEGGNASPGRCPESRGLDTDALPLGSGDELMTLIPIDGFRRP